MAGVIDDLRRSGATVVVATHSAALIELADGVIRLDGGRVIVAYAQPTQPPNRSREAEKAVVSG